MIQRRTLVISGLATAAAFVAVTPRRHVQVAAQTLSGPATPPSAPATLAAEPWAQQLIAAAESQIGETIRYDPAYVKLAYPGGDVPADRGVCSDVVIRAYRQAFGLDLQRLVHEDMAKSFSAYPKTWGLARPDRNIDHRRVPNLETFLKRRKASLPVSSDPAGWRPGDLVTQRLPGNLPHIAIVTARLSDDGVTPLVVHNIGAGTRIENRLFTFDIAGHFRFAPERA